MQRNIIPLKNIHHFKQLLTDQRDLPDVSVQLINLNKNETLFDEGDLCNYFLLVINGLIKIERIAAGGGQLVLYHVGPQQACQLSTACLLAGQTHQALAIAETATTAVLLEKKAFFELFNHSSDFQRYVFGIVNKAADNLLAKMEEIVFVSMDQRLAKYLLQRHTENNPIHITHHEIASELGTAREVVSRLLKAFEQRQWIHRERGKIWVKGCTAMELFVDGNKITEQ